MQAKRELERKRLVEEGVLIGENQAVKLEDAVDFHGLCTTFCSPFEVVKRVHQNAVDPCEKVGIWDTSDIDPH